MYKRMAKAISKLKILGELSSSLPSDMGLFVVISFLYLTIGKVFAEGMAQCPPGPEQYYACPPPTPTSTGPAQKYSQCGGLGFTGSTVCVAGTLCIFDNIYYSQCLPCTLPTCTSCDSASIPITAFPSGACPTCSCTVGTTTTPASSIPSSTGATCPTLSCPGCSSGQIITQTTAAGASCASCACAMPSTTAPPATSTATTTTGWPLCTLTTCAACPSGETLVVTPPTSTSCAHCACVEGSTAGSAAITAPPSLSQL